MNFNFGEVLTRAWEIVWKHRVLWVFGILASCGRSGVRVNIGGGGRNAGGANIPPQVAQLFQWIENNVTTFLILFCLLFLIIWLISIAISTVGKIGLIRGTAQVEGGAQSLIFGQLFSEGTPYFGRVFGLSVLLLLPVLLVAIIAAAVAVTGLAASQRGDAAFGAAGIASLALCCVCLFIPVMIVLSVIFSQAERAVVLDDMGLMPALSQGWEIFRKNLGPIILMAIILGVISIVVGIILALPIFIIVFPAATAFMLGNPQNSTPIYLGVICFCLYLPIWLLLNGILVAYTDSAWTLTYMRLTRKPDAEAGLTPESDLPLPPVEDSNKTILSSRSNA